MAVTAEPCRELSAIGDVAGGIKRLWDSEAGWLAAVSGMMGWPCLKRAAIPVQAVVEAGSQLELGDWRLSLDRS